MKSLELPEQDMSSFFSDVTDIDDIVENLLATNRVDALVASMLDDRLEIFGEFLSRNLPDFSIDVDELRLHFTPLVVSTILN